MSISKLEWLQKCKSWKERWPVSQEQGDKLNNDDFGINLYNFIDSLNNNLKKDSVVVTDAGSAYCICGQNLKLSKNQRFICSLAQAEMGASISMGCGVSFAINKKETIVVTGDGSLNTQINSLAIVRKHNLPLKIFILNNYGYLSIKNSQDKFYGGQRIGTDSNDGIFFPSIKKIAEAYEIKYSSIPNISELDTSIKLILSTDEPIVCEVICQELQDISPSIVGEKKEDGKIEQCDFSNMSPFIENIQEEMVKD